MRSPATSTRTRIGTALADGDAVVVHEGFGLVDPVGIVAHAGARRGLALIHDRGDRRQHRVAPVFLDHLEEAALAGPDRGDLGAEIAHRALGQAHIGADDGDQISSLATPCAIGLDDRHLQAFGDRCRW